MYKTEIPTITKNIVPTTGFLLKSLKLIGNGFAETSNFLLVAIMYDYNFK
jgi:hypothetical protein